MATSQTYQHLENDPFTHVIPEKLKALSENTNINATTLLTTDYLNHFSTFLMLLEMLPQDPETFALDILTWKPISYEDHLRQSGLRDSALAVELYQYTNKTLRKAFCKTIAQLNEACIADIENIRKGLDEKDNTYIQQVCDISIPQMQELIQQLTDIINGNEQTINGVSAQDEANTSQKQSTQDYIDELF